ncbi:MAG TPA: TerC/Alx family metal homeostasis membrane protein [Verrucomicrobiae bacterium]|nr:TerC/Alx family metal homeostasis membrane protein [Verrucomicrobiae bacterium]
MATPIPIRAWHWVGFILMILFCVGLDLGLFQRAPRVVKLSQALRWTGIWLLLALLFASLLAHWRSEEESLQFLTGYLVEYSLSLDNVLAIAVIFASFGVAAEHQHRVLSLGIVGALLMRGIMIGAGAALLQTFHWLLFGMGLFLVVTGLRWGFSKPTALRPQDNPVIRLARKIFPVSASFDGGRFVTMAGGRRALTPLALVLLAVETTDLVFAVDSIPAVFAVTQNPFIVFTSNIFAILGLRSLYFVVAGAIGTFRFLRTGLACVLVVIGLKMLVAPWWRVPTSLSLGAVLLIVALAIGCSVLAARRDSRQANHPGLPP